MRRLTSLALFVGMVAIGVGPSGCSDDGGATTGTGGTGGTASGAGGAGGSAASAKAEAKLDPTSMTSMTKGDAKFSVVGAEVALDFKVEGATPGMHGLHIHAMGACGSTTDMAGVVTPGGAAGGHWNPEMMMHGSFGTAPHHLGDIGNVTVGADGKGTLTFKTNRWTIATGMANDIVGKAVVFHAMADDGKTDPTGNAGGRVSCGVISKASP